MINLLSIRCSLAFAPYVAESTSEFLNDGVVTSRVVRQGSSGLIVRSDGDIVLRHQNRQVQLGRAEARHYSATVGFRHEFYQVARMEDEVVMANVGGELLLSHPQSDLWLTRRAVAALLQTFSARSGSTSPSGLPEWVTVSAGGGRLLISDQRNGRWVLLGEDHIREIERRLALLEFPREASALLQPPTISLKGVTVHLQSASKLAETLEEFAETGRFQSFADRAPAFFLSAREATEGIEITDETSRVGLTAKEARKWAEIIRGELARLNSSCMTRGKIRTVFADAEQGRWVLQWGDEVLVSDTLISQPAWERRQPCLLGLDLSASEKPAGKDACAPRLESLEVKRADDCLLVLAPATGACVALDHSELARLSE
jgi:hypothetical protein